MKLPRFSAFSRAFSSPARKILLSGALFISLLGGCSGVSTDPTYKDKQKDDLYKYGSLASDSGGISILGGKEKKKTEGLGVNAYLWRAALDTISFMPIASADPFGGLITTDWHSTEASPNERVKLNILILDRDLRADGVKVSVFRQTRGVGGDWADASSAAATASSLEETILTRARQLRLAQKEGK